MKSATGQTSGTASSDVSVIMRCIPTASISWWPKANALLSLYCSIRCRLLILPLLKKFHCTETSCLYPSIQRLLWEYTRLGGPRILSFFSMGPSDFEVASCLCHNLAFCLKARGCQTTKYCHTHYAHHLSGALLVWNRRLIPGPDTGGRARV